VFERNENSGGQKGGFVESLQRKEVSTIEKREPFFKKIREGESYRKKKKNIRRDGTREKLQNSLETEFFWF